jgi:hypothetical protein
VGKIASSDRIIKTAATGDFAQRTRASPTLRKRIGHATFGFPAGVIDVCTI